jgi:hypothetical protein
MENFFDHQVRIFDEKAYEVWKKSATYGASTLLPSWNLKQDF